MEGPLRMIKRQLKRLTDAPNPNFGAGPLEEDGWACDGFVRGPQGSPYEGGLFRLRIWFHARFPFEPLIVSFTTPIFHPNVDKCGCVDIAMLRDRWAPHFTVAHVLQTIWELLKTPKIAEAMNDRNVAVIKMYKSKYSKYASTAKAFTKKYG